MTTASRIFQSESPSRAATAQRVQKAQLAGLVNNRPSAVQQHKIQAMADRRPAQLVKKPTAQRQPVYRFDQAQMPLGGTAQLKPGNPFKYFYNRFLRRNAPPVPQVTQVPVPQVVQTPELTEEEQLDAYVAAYKQSRAYHQVKYSTDMASDPITKQPITDNSGRQLTVEESVRLNGLQTKFGGTGNSVYMGLERRCQGKIHLGRDLEKRDVSSYGEVMFRPFLPKNRTIYHGDPYYSQGRPEELYRDPDHGIYGVTTRTDIGPEHIMYGSNKEMLQDYDNGSANAQQILRNVQSNMADGNQYTLDQLAALHRRALGERRFSL